MEIVYDLPKQGELYRRLVMRMMEDEWKQSLSPMPYHKEVLNSWRVVMRTKPKDKYYINLGDNYVRSFNYENLPDFIKHKITFAQVEDPITTDYQLSYPDAFVYSGSNTGLKHIGWRASESYYVLILTKQEMDSLKGESINKEHHDSRKESKEQSNENIKRRGLLFFLPTNWRIWK